MFNNKLKKVLSIALATAVTFSGLTIAPVDNDNTVKVEAATTTEELGDGTAYRYRVISDIGSLGRVGRDSSNNKLKVCKDNLGAYNRSFLWEKTKTSTDTEENLYVLQYIQGGKPIDKDSFEFDGVKWSGVLVEASYKKVGTNTTAYSKYIITGVTPTSTKNLNPNCTLPSTVSVRVDGKNYTADCVELAEYALAGTNIEKLHIPDTYQRICDGAFADCTSLVSVDFAKIDASGSVISTEDGSSLHALGSRAFAGCSKLTSPIILDNLFRLQKVTTNSSELPINTSYNVRTRGGASYNYIYKDDDYNKSQNVTVLEDSQSSSYTKSPYKNVRGEDSGTGDYYMGSAVFQDCYSITSVNLGGKDLKQVYVPENTFAGCTNLASLNISSDVSEIVIGKSAFAGSEGRAGNKLTELEFNCDVILDCFAFSNCHNLIKVTFKKGFNNPELMGYSVKGTTNVALFNGYVSSTDYNMYDKWSAYTSFYGNFYGIFSNSFSSDGKTELIIEPYTKSDGTKELILPNGFLVNSKLNTLDLNTKDATLKVDMYAFRNVNAGTLELTAKDLILNRHSLANYYGSQVKLIAKNELSTYGEIFADTLKSTTSVNTCIKKVYMDAPVVNMTDGIAYSYGTASVSSKATFYGLGYETSLYYGDTVKEIKSRGYTGSTVYTDSKKNTELHEFLGGIKNVYITSPKTRISKGALGISAKENTDGTVASVTGGSKYTLYGYDGVAISDSETGQTYSSYANQSAGYITFKSYISDLVIQPKKGNNIKVVCSGFTGDCLTVTAVYSDGTQEIIEYSGDNSDSITGYALGQNAVAILEPMIANPSSVTEELNRSFDIVYKGFTKNIGVTIEPVRITDYEVTVKEGKTFVQGTGISASDFSISDIVYNDSKEGVYVPALSATDKVEVSLLNSLDGKLVEGKNTVKISVNGTEKTFEVVANPASVVSMSAVLAHEVYEGETLDTDDFKVTAYYNNGTQVEDFKDFVVLTTDKLTTDTKLATVALKGNENIAAVVNLDGKVNKLVITAITARYTGDGVIAGQSVDASKVEVFAQYNNLTASTEKLSSDKYTLFYPPIVGDTDNYVTVILNEDNTKQATFKVRGIKATVYDTPAPATEVPVVTIAPTATAEVTKAPTDTTEIPVVTTAPTTAPATSGTPGATETNTPATSTTPATSSTPTPTAPATTEVPVPTATTVPVPTQSVPNAEPVVGKTKTSKVTLGVKEKLTVKATTPLKSYTSSNTKIAIVSAKGVITAKKVGKATITIVDGSGATLKVTVTVKKAPKKISANFKKKTLKKGKTVTLKAKFAKGYYSNKIKFTSSNKKVATVTSKGVIKAKKKGTCKITMKTYNGKKITVKITVK